MLVKESPFTPASTISSGYDGRCSFDACLSELRDPLDETFLWPLTGLLGAESIPAPIYSPGVGICGISLPFVRGFVTGSGGESGRTVESSVASGAAAAAYDTPSTGWEAIVATYNLNWVDERLCVVAVVVEEDKIKFMKLSKLPELGSRRWWSHCSMTWGNRSISFCGLSYGPSAAPSSTSTHRLSPQFPVLVRSRLGIEYELS
jgi:hypothetical protein